MGRILQNHRLQDNHCYAMNKKEAINSECIMPPINPSPVLHCARVLSYVEIDDSVTYTERACFFVGGKLLGRVPRLAICQYLDETEILVFHCDNEWNLLGAQGGFHSVEEAKARVERSYAGLMNKWTDTSVTESEAREYLEEAFSDKKCSFCGRWPTKVKQMIGEDVRICNHCVDEFYGMLHKNDKT